VEKNSFAKKSAILGMGTATHMDSACHVYMEPCTSITDYNITQYTMTPLRIINVTEQVFGGNGDSDYEVTVADLLASEAAFGVFENRAFIQMLSGWSNRVYHTELYENRDASGQKHFPGWSPEAVEWLLTNRPWISGIGVDTSSIDAAVNWHFNAHYMINAFVKVSVENVKLTDRNIPLTGSYINNVPNLFQGGPEATVAGTIHVYRRRRPNQ